MTQYNPLNKKLSNLRLNKLKSRKNGTEVTLKLLSKIVGNFNDECNFSQKFLLTNTHVSKICNAFANVSTVSMNFSKTQVFTMVQLGDHFRV